MIVSFLMSDNEECFFDDWEDENPQNEPSEQPQKTENVEKPK